jgi:prepilin signal peptidase PulO-like enzyme (type II secretory pathway)
MLYEALVWLGFGLIFGSFTNVLILRHGTRSLDGRSSCQHCGKTLAWYELIPVVSWIALKGKCSSCRKPISIQYPLVELAAGLSFLAFGFAPLPLIAQILGCVIAVLFIAVFVYDLYHMLMPDRWVWSFNAAALVFSLYLLSIYAPQGDWMPYAWLFAAGPLVSLPLFLMWSVSRGAWMGFGDVKFALGIGWLLGVGYGYLALMYSFVIGAIVGVAILIPMPHIVKTLRSLGITRLGAGREGFTMKSEVPFGPFLIIGTSIVWLALIYSYAPILGFPEALVLWN